MCPAIKLDFSGQHKTLLSMYIEAVNFIRQQEGQKPSLILMNSYLKKIRDVFPKMFQYKKLFKAFNLRIGIVSMKFRWKMTVILVQVNIFSIHLLFASRRSLKKSIMIEGGKKKENILFIILTIIYTPIFLLKTSLSSSYY